MEEIKQNDLITKTRKKICKILDYIEHLHVLVCTVTRSISIFAFGSLVGNPVGLTSFLITRKTSILLNIAEFPWICLEMPEKNVLTISRLSICHNIFIIKLL